ncbi:hypothetical protein SLEP1_g50401 [Rubroshorea leprosula]|uniref:Uncharacterized protein n=1 Tax=Rubroshorea leprosula TaxID=152421 RepID=A0AAV5LZZ8_9ROSI|nr:hypothetical protein SLEP1_g50401 [Rubroshorea leprosula]
MAYLVALENLVDFTLEVPSLEKAYHICKRWFHEWSGFGFNHGGGRFSGGYLIFLVAIHGNRFGREKGDGKPLPDSALLLLAAAPEIPLQVADTSFENFVRKLGISPSFLSKNLTWNPEIFPLYWKFQICLALLVFSAGC